MTFSNELIARRPDWATGRATHDATPELLEAAAAGDVASWGVLLTQYVERLSRFIALRMDRRLTGRIDAEDVIQEIYVEAWRCLPAYQRDGTLPFYLWLRGVARNKLLELHRRHLSTKMRDARREAGRGRLDGREPTSVTFTSLLLDSQTSPSNAAVREESRAQLQDALETMNPIDREVLLLRHFEHLSPRETAEVLGLHEKAAGMRYVRALQRLREILDSLPGGLSAFR